MQQTRSQVAELARIAAISNYSKDLVYRRWAASQGGVYVESNPQTPPNPYLDPADREVKTTSGKSLTLINPAYMTRQVNEINRSEHGILGHITSLKPIRPGNAADAWETNALLAFQSGTLEVSSVEQMNGRPYLRVMRPMVTEKSCLKCHASQGYREGDIRGGISVSVPMSPYYSIVYASDVTDGLISFALAGAGVIAIWAGHRRLQRYLAERLEAEQSLRESNNRYEQLVYTAPTPIMAHQDGRFVFVNNATMALFKAQSRDELIGTPVINRVHPDYRDAVNKRIKQVETEQAVMPIIEEKLLCLDGAVIDAEVTATPFFYLGRPAVQILVRDITERKRTEAQIRKLSRAVEQSPVSVIITDPFGRIEYVNPKFTQVTGYTLEESHGHNPHLLTGDKTSPEIYRQLWDTITKGQEWHGDLQIRKKNGELYWESASVSPTADANGNITHFLWVKEDITNRKNLEAQLHQAQKLESIGRLAGGIAHDFNNMLTAINGNVSLVLEDLPANSPWRENLEDAQKCTQRSTDLTAQLLAFARKQAVAPRRLDLNETVEGTLKMLRRLIGENIELTWRPGKNLHFIKIDPNQISQILANLCVNARDALTASGKIILETENVTLGQEHSQTHPGALPGDYVLLAVTDDGCGMSEEVLSHIFEPFFTTKDVGKGTGLGLATVYGIVEQNQGFIKVASELGKGTTFKIYLPQHASDPKQVARQSGVYN